MPCLAQFRRRQPLDGRGRADRHEARRLDRSVRQLSVRAARRRRVAMQVEHRCHDVRARRTYCRRRSAVELERRRRCADARTRAARRAAPGRAARSAGRRAVDRIVERPDVRSRRGARESDACARFRGGRSARRGAAIRLAHFVVRDRAACRRRRSRTSGGCADRGRSGRRSCRERVSRNAAHEPEILALDASRAFIALPSARERRVASWRRPAIPTCRGRAGGRVPAAARRRAARRRCASSALTSVPLARPCAGMRHHAGGFVDDDQIVVFVDDRDLDRFGSRDRAVRGGDVELEHVARFRAAGSA